MSDRQLVDAARELAAILAAENAALAAVDFTGAARLTAAKHAAADAFARASAAARASGRAADSGATGASHDAEAAIRALALPQLAETNRQLLERALVVQRRVIQTFARAVPRTSAAPRYGAHGTLTHGTRATPVALVARA